MSVPTEVARESPLALNRNPRFSKVLARLTNGEMFPSRSPTVREVLVMGVAVLMGVA
jgi:hypothetical protein